MKWKDAFLTQSYDACIGRSFRGLIHNLNGVNQALILQAALFKSMFERADVLLGKLAADGYESESLQELRELLRKRATLADQMEQKIETSKNLVSSSLPLQQVCVGGDSQPLSVKKVIDLAIEISSARSFFKHNIEKRIEIADQIPLITHHHSVVYSILHSMLCNAEEAMTAVQDDDALLEVRAFKEGEWFIFTVADSGHGITPETADRVFDPFYTTRKENLGVGLTCAKEAASALSGDISFESVPGRTVFTVKLPLSKLVGSSLERL